MGVVSVDGGAPDSTAASDAVDAARQLMVLSGDLTIAADDGGHHCDNVLRVAGRDVSITARVEGIEAAYLYRGDVAAVSSDGTKLSGGLEALTETTAEATDGTAAEPVAVANGRQECGPPLGDPSTGRPGRRRCAGPGRHFSATVPVDDL